jgi:hypothetical protein
VHVAVLFDGEGLGSQRKTELGRSRLWTGHGDSLAPLVGAASQGADFLYRLLRRVIPDAPPGGPRDMRGLPHGVQQRGSSCLTSRVPLCMRGGAARRGADGRTRGERPISGCRAAG